MMIKLLDNTFEERKMQLEGANGIKVDVVIEHARVPPFNLCA